MKLSFVCFTKSGAGLLKLYMENLTLFGDQCQGFCPERLKKDCPAAKSLAAFSVSVSEWARERFLSDDGIVFIGAAAIAVRAVAPFLRGKEKDPAVVVSDDMGYFVISLLSGHLGGANELAKRLAAVSGGQAVITTATDIHGRFAVDLFAKELGLFITDLKKAKAVSSAALRGESIGFFSDFPVEGTLPSAFAMDQHREENIWITIREDKKERKFTGALTLIPPLLVLGLGCRRGTSEASIQKAVQQVLDREKLSLKAVAACATIDLKKDEKGLLEFSAEKGLKLYTYPAEILKQVQGSLSASSFVKQVTGVDNVCERAALSCVMELGGGSLLVEKEALQGVTVAVAVLDWKVKF